MYTVWGGENTWGPLLIAFFIQIVTVPRLHFTWVDLYQASLPLSIPYSLLCNCSGQTLARLNLLRMPRLYIDVNIGELY